MGQFKPMVKMFTDEPSVILKLKKGGKVEKKADGGFMPMASTQPAGLPARGGVVPAAAPMRPALALRRRAMNPNLLMKKGGKAEEKHEDAAQDRAMIKKALAGKKFASGGEIDKAATRTTIEGNAGKFAKTKMHDGDKTDKAHGTKGIKEKNAGGYAMGGTIEGNAGKFVKTKVVDGDKTDKAHGTGGIKESNAGGYAKGGKVPGIGRAIEGGNWENRPADTAKAGKVNGTTGGVRESNAGGYKKGGSAKKAFATGGNVVSDGKAEKMPRHFVSRPVANSLQSGTFKKGGKVKRFADGDSVTIDLPKKFDANKVAGDAGRDLEEAMNPLSMIKELYTKGRNYFSGNADKAPGAVTKTKESVTVAPKKRGGRA